MTSQYESKHEDITLGYENKKGLINMENKQEDLDALRSRIEKLSDEYFTIEEKILSEIKKLPRHDNECDCDNRNGFCIVDDDIVTCYCLDCGGFLLQF